MPKRKDKKKVILSFPEPETWTFLDYCSSDGKSVIEVWLDGEGDEVDIALNALLKQLAKTKNHLEWMGWRGFLQGDKYKEERIWELGFKVDDKQYRVFGRWEGKKQTILFCGCYHKQEIYTPADALDTALKRAREVSQGKARLSVRQIQTDF